MTCSTVNMCRKRLGDCTHSCSLARASERSSMSAVAPLLDLEVFALGIVAALGLCFAFELLDRFGGAAALRVRVAAKRIGRPPRTEPAGKDRPLRRVVFLGARDVPGDLVGG